MSLGNEASEAGCVSCGHWGPGNDEGAGVILPLALRAGHNGSSRDGGYESLTRGACPGLAPTSTETLCLCFFKET